MRRIWQSIDPTLLDSVDPLHGTFWIVAALVIGLGVPACFLALIVRRMWCVEVRQDDEVQRAVLTRRRTCPHQRRKLRVCVAARVLGLVRCRRRPVVWFPGTKEPTWREWLVELDRHVGDVFSATFGADLVNVYLCRTRRQFVGGLARRLSDRVKAGAEPVKEDWVRLTDTDAVGDAVLARYEFLFGLSDQFRPADGWMGRVTADHEMIHFYQQAVSDVLDTEAECSRDWHDPLNSRWKKLRTAGRLMLTLLWTETEALVVGSLTLLVPVLVAVFTLFLLIVLVR